MATLTLRREDGRIVCERVVVADRAHRRMRGLLGRKYLRQGEGMVLRPGWSIHTAFMRFPIDVVFLDADQVVIRDRARGRPVADGVVPRRARGGRAALPASASGAASRSATASPGRRAARRTHAPSAGRDVRRRARRAARARPRREQRPALPASSLASCSEAAISRSRSSRPRSGSRTRFSSRRSTSPCSTAPTRSPTRCAPRTPRVRGDPRSRSIIAADTGGKSPSGMRVFDRWNETEELLLDDRATALGARRGSGSTGTVTRPVPRGQESCIRAGTHEDEAVTRT